MHNDHGQELYLKGVMMTGFLSHMLLVGNPSDNMWKLEIDGEKNSEIPVHPLDFGL